MADLIIRKTERLIMSGGSSVKSVSNPSSFALMMYFGSSVEVSSCVNTVNTIVIESVSSIVIGTDYDSISTNCSIGTTIQIHGPPMVDNRTCLHSFTVFTVIPKMSYQYKNKNFKTNNRKCG